MIAGPPESQLKSQGGVAFHRLIQRSVAGSFVRLSDRELMTDENGRVTRGKGCYAINCESWSGIWNGVLTERNRYCPATLCVALGRSRGTAPPCPP
jgi:hypothetical protein